MPGLPTLLREIFRPAGAPSDACVLTFRGETLRDLSGAVPEGLGLAPGQHWTVVAAAFGAGVTPRLGALIERGEGFRQHLRDAAGGLMAIEGRVSGLCALLSVQRASAREAALYDRATELGNRLAVLSAARKRHEESPLATIEIDGEGVVLWHNAAARPLLGAAWPPDADGPRLIRTPEGTPIGWYHCTSRSIAGGGRLLFLEDKDTQLRAEQALESFMATLTDTFAHLDAGLAIFDRDRRLCLFNPALGELFDLDPVALAQRPSLREFLSALRERRMIPEPSNFTDWRDRLVESVSTVTALPHTEDWSLPSGRILRLTARPHPRGATAFIFEDISGHVALERSYRDEIEQGQATLDRLGEGVAVFAGSGRLIFANRALGGQLGVDGFADLPGPGIDAFLEQVEAATGPSPAWRAFRDYALALGRGERWDSLAEAGQRRLLLRASALPDGSTLLCVTEIGRPAAIPGSEDAPALSRAS